MAVGTEAGFPPWLPPAGGLSPWCPQAHASAVTACVSWFCLQVHPGRVFQPPQRRGGGRESGSYPPLPPVGPDAVPGPAWVWLEELALSVRSEILGALGAEWLWGGRPRAAGVGSASPGTGAVGHSSEASSRAWVREALHNPRRPCGWHCEQERVASETCHRAWVREGRWGQLGKRQGLVASLGAGLEEDGG